MSPLRINEDARVGRMLAGLLASENNRGKVLLTVTVRRPDRVSELHETFRLHKWVSRAGAPILFVDLPDTADWDAGVRPLTAASLNLRTGELRQDRDERLTPLIAWAARAALRYATTGAAPAPGNGTAEILEHDFCGCCGLPLSDPESIRLGIGPDCEKRITGKARTKRTRLMPIGGQ